VTEYDVTRFYDAKTDQLTPRFYDADRAMRESGFDPSARFGPFSAGIVKYNPVDLNSLLYRTEMDCAAILEVLGYPREAEPWKARAQRRATAINKLMWNEDAGLYYDYDFRRQRQSHYNFLTTFYPLWAGLASQEQAARVAANLGIFERAGGLQTSDVTSGNQWDAPFAFAPLHVLAVKGLRQYGFRAEADRISRKFIAMVVNDFVEHGTIKEKYNAVTAESDVTAHLKFGYTSNEVGFGWTNAAIVLFCEELGIQPTQANMARAEERTRNAEEGSTEH
jgi:alpha,alpha-trehalase